MTTNTPLRGCPFCDKNPKHHLGKRTYCQLHGDPSQDYIIYCGDNFDVSHARVSKSSKQEAIDCWNTRAGETTWQAISSAPRDGTRILVYNDSEGGYHTEPYDIGVAEYSTSMGKYHWCSIACCDGVSYYTPTHWKPLPSPPTGEKK